MSIEQAKPSILEIAAMPYPASELAMRKYYDPHWRKYSNGETAKFKVEVEYTFRSRDTWECDVDAADEAEAEKMAMDLFDKADLDCDGGEFEDVQNVTVARAA